MPAKHDKEQAKKELFDVKQLREAIALRWAQEPLRDLVSHHIKEMERSSSSSEGETVSDLQCCISEVIVDIRKNLSPKPWHDTLRLVTYDLPSNAEGVLNWIELFVSGRENQGATEKIVLQVPGMKEHPETALFMQQMILPFRSFLVAQVVSHFIGTATDRASATTPQSDVSNPAATGSVVLAAQQHAAHHAKDLEDVDAITSLLNVTARLGLEKHIAIRRKQSVCTRFAEYCLLFLSVEPSRISDSEWANMLKPFAEAGLCHAQFNLGACLLRGSDTTAEGVEWLKRACANGHSGAMLRLGRHYGEMYLANCIGAHHRPPDDKAAKPVGARQQLYAQAMQYLEDCLDTEWDWDSDSHHAEAQQMIYYLTHTPTSTVRRTFMTLKKGAILVIALSIIISVVLRLLIPTVESLQHGQPQLE